MENRLSRFRAKSQDVILKGDDKPLAIKGLSFPELTEFAQYMERKDTNGALNYLLFSTLRKAIPKEGENALTDEQIKEEINNMDASVAMDIIDKVRNVSGISTEEDKKKEDTLVNPT